ncbi:MAG: EAL domain-containing protein, partial [Candidatus Competibacteraceae bacterium]|nr:EAL domain-containing protein [Candidatus Competibacteraceae bacterium]
IEPEGLMCVSTRPASASDDPIADPQPIITAAMGRYRYLIQRHLTEIDDPRIAECLTRCLTERHNVVDECSLTLFFAGREGHDFAAFVASAAPLREVDQHLLEVFCINIALCADNIALVSHLRNQAFVDRLVSLPNRTAFIDAVDQRLKSGECAGMVIALIDVDQFAEINDMLGHHYGDHLLCAMARRLEQAPLDQCLVARIAGDKFGVFGDERLVQPEILQPIFTTPFNIQEVQHTVSISMGLVQLSACFAERGAELIKDASIALKHAKSSGIGQTAYYSDTIRTETRERTRLLHELRHAFNHDHLFIVYQPQLSLHSEEVIGVEALMRWRAEDGRFVPPDRFIPVAERSGLIVGLGNWVLRIALHALARLRAAGYDRLRMAVNVSAVQFRQPDFLQTVEEALRDTGTNPEALELEITESVAALGFGYVEKLLHQLKSAGIGVAIDDFGTGFSSLSYLDRLPADRLKIDKSFVWALDSQQPGRRIADIVIELGRKLGMNVLAEGVETAAQTSLLRDLGCDDAQGYYFGKPMSLDELLSWLPAPRGESQ